MNGLFCYTIFQQFSAKSLDSLVTHGILFEVDKLEKRHKNERKIDKWKF